MLASVSYDSHTAILKSYVLRSEAEHGTKWSNLTV